MKLIYLPKSRPKNFVAPVPVTQDIQVGLYGKDQVGVSGKDHVGVSEKDQVGVSGKDQVVVSGKDQVSVSERVHVGVSGIDPAGVSGSVRKEDLEQINQISSELTFEKQPGTIEDPGGKSNLSKLSELSTDHERYFAEIKQAMEPGKLYLDPDLNLAKLSAHTGIPPKQISAVLNQYNQTNFNDFINSYRVSQVSLLMVDPSTRNLTISRACDGCRI